MSHIGNASTATNLTAGAKSPEVFIAVALAAIGAP